MKVFMTTILGLEIGVGSVRVPLTMSFRHSQPHTWYVSSSRRPGVRSGAAA